MTIFRPASEADLRSMYEVFYQNEIHDSPHPPPPGNTPSYLRHILQHGTLTVGELDGQVLAFAGAIQRGKITFLTDLFVLPEHQSGHLGKTLLHSQIPQNGLVHCTVSSSDPRALALYIRLGMRPQWPLFALSLEKSTRAMPVTPDVEIIQADPHDPEVVRWDTQISGLPRPVDHLYWVHEQQSIPLWFRRHQQIVGYGYVRRDAETVWHPNAWVLGPIGVNSAEDATPCVLAMVNWALQQTDLLLIEVPGPHPCLAVLLESGFRIIAFDTFVSTVPFFDGQCYIPSGGDLF